MQDCKKIEQLLAAYADGELSEEQKALVEQHVATCPHCKALLGEYLALNDALASCTVQAPEGFADRVMDAVEKQKTAAPKSVGRGVRLGRIAPFMGVAAAAVICISVAGTALVKYVIENLDGSDLVQTPNAPMEEVATELATEEVKTEAETVGEPETEYEQLESAAPEDTAEETVGDTDWENAEPEGTQPESSYPEGIYPEGTDEKDDAPADSAEVTMPVTEGLPVETIPETDAPETAVPETEKAPNQAPEEAPTQAPEKDSALGTQEAPVPEDAASGGWLARVWNAVVEFFESLFEGLKRLFGGAHA